MKLFETLAATTLPALKTQKRDAEKFFVSGVKNHLAFNKGMVMARRGAIEAGFDFLQARPGFQHGDWEMHCRLYAKEISERSIRRYMELADISWRWVLYKNPGVKDIAKVRELAIEMVLVSPKPIVELCRELGHMLKFGGYYAEEYEMDKKNRLLNGAQIEFEFDKIFSTVELLANFDDSKFRFKFSEGVDQVGALTDLKTKMLLGIEKLDAQIKDWEAVPI